MALSALFHDSDILLDSVKVAKLAGAMFATQFIETQPELKPVVADSQPVDEQLKPTGSIYHKYSVFLIRLLMVAEVPVKLPAKSSGKLVPKYNL